MYSVGSRFFNIIQSAGLFLIIGVGIVKGIKALKDWIVAKRENDKKRENGQQPTKEEQVTEKRNDQAAEDNNGVVENHKQPAVDREDASTFIRAKNPQTGENLVSYDGEAVFLVSPIPISTTPR